MSRRDDLRVEFAKSVVAGLYADPTVKEIDPVKICDAAERIADEIIRRETAEDEERKQAVDKPRMMICQKAKNKECREVYCGAYRPHIGCENCRGRNANCPVCVPVAED